MHSTLKLSVQAGIAPLLRPIHSAWQAWVGVSAVHARIAYDSPWLGDGNAAPVKKGHHAWR